MKPGYPPLNKFVITYDSKTKLFNMVDRDGNHIDSDDRTGRELGRYAFETLGADEVRYDYDAKLDDDILLRPRHAKY